MTGDTFAPYIYAALCGLVLVEVLSAGFGRKMLWQMVTGLRIFVCLLAVVLTGIAIRRPPLFGDFEALVQILLVMGGLAQVFGRRPAVPRGFYLCHSLFALVLLAIHLGQPMALNLDFYMYGHMSVILFFNLRLTAAGCLAHGTVQHICLLFSKQGCGMDDTLSRGGRNSLLSGAGIFLVSEWAGSFWCLNWLGDAWQWSRGFLTAAILFLLVMAACHLPKKAAGWKYSRPLAGSLPGVYILWMIFSH